MLAWVEGNLTFRERQARKYMRVARHRQELEEANRTSNADLTIDGALALLAEPRTGHATIFDELLDLGCVFEPLGLSLPEGLPFEEWAKIGELLEKIEAGSDDMAAWMNAQASLQHHGKKLMAELERLEPRQAAIVAAVDQGDPPPPDAEAVVEATRAWLSRAELWLRASARYSLALANARLRDAV